MIHHDVNAIERPAPWLATCDYALSVASDFAASPALKRALSDVLHGIEWEHLPLPTWGHPFNCPRGIQIDFSEPRTSRKITLVMADPCLLGFTLWVFRRRRRGGWEADVSGVIAIPREAYLLRKALRFVRVAPGGMGNE